MENIFKDPHLCWCYSSLLIKYRHNPNVFKLMKDMDIREKVLNTVQDKILKPKNGIVDLMDVVNTVSKKTEEIYEQKLDQEDINLIKYCFQDVLRKQKRKWK